jgi:hypothetical protein
MKWIGFILFGSISLAGCAQQNVSSAQRVDAFVQVRIPGIIPAVPGQNKQRSYSDTAYVIYLQANQKPAWTKARNSNQSFRIETTVINESPVTVGIEKTSGKEIKLTPEDGQQLYRLTLKKEMGNNKPEKRVNGGEMLLEGEVNGKSVFHLVRRFTELQSPLYQ